MIKRTAIRFAGLIALASSLTACSLVPDSSSASVQIAADTYVELPQPAALGYQVTASQLISATWHTEKGANTQQLPVQLQVKNNQVVLAGFSSWGTRILSLDYQNEQVNTQVLNGLEGSLPQPEQVLFNLMITLWPQSTWEAPLNKVRWSMVDTKQTRTVYNQQGKKVITVRYGADKPLDGDILFHNELLDYSIKIQTLNYQTHNEQP